MKTKYNPYQHILWLEIMGLYDAYGHISRKYYEHAFVILPISEEIKLYKTYDEQNEK
jgi:hypothetical protein